MLSATDRPKLLTSLLAEVDSFEAVYESHDAVAEGETPRGTLSPWLVNCYSLARYYVKQSRLLSVERDYDDMDEWSLDAEVMELRSKAQLLMEIMWTCTRAEFNLWAESNVGLRKNFTVISSEPKGDEGGFRKFMSRMFEK